jgi:hypothetical protein
MWKHLNSTNTKGSPLCDEKKNWGEGWGQKKHVKKKLSRDKINVKEQKKAQKKKKKAEKEKNDADHVGDSFIPSMKSQNEIFWMVHWWVLGHSSPTLS